MRGLSLDVALKPTRSAPESNGAVISITGLTKVYPGGLVAVENLDLDVREGEIFGLLGPNGAGKTTTVGMLTSRVIPTRGTASIGGVDVVAHPTLAKQLIGVVSQSNTLDRSLSVRDNLYFHGRYFGMSARAARAAADETLEKFRLADRANADVGELSGGMAQRLMVARAILHRPRILFLDEPTAGLDPQSRLALWEILGELHDAGETILLTTHYMEEADKLCDRLAIMDHGHLLSLDTPTNLKRSIDADTQVKVTAEGDLGALATHLQTLSGITDARVVEDVVNVTAKGRKGLLPSILDHAEEGGFTITDVSASEPTLETVFIRLTGKDLRE
jgi:ABC-2 type transport system ATP-binding protein